jgi:hypothetical protein
MGQDPKVSRGEYSDESHMLLKSPLLNFKGTLIMFQSQHNFIVLSLAST